jgi:acyl carrier protein
LIEHHERNRLELLDIVVGSLESLFDGVRDVRLEAAFGRDLGLDSLDLVEVAMEIESRLSIKFGDDDLKAVFTVGDLVEVLTMICAAD